ncbi:MAG: DUF4189 domain-containing protein [Xanthobacteraceae bacterium]|nr:DUF4189 domain-containing protein [Xanthobacteraceae bacterium]QYK46315.1 MAG: DUF4189 domain-containing protein [Xanthobacteraceae bacterium]
MKRALFAALVLSVSAFASAPAMAEGAIAVGILDNNAARGYSAGWAVNQPNAEAARNLALQRCREEQNAPANVKAQCRIVSTFRNECVSVALDPKDGTPGAGWAVEPSRQSSDRAAASACERVAGRDRQGQCTLVRGACDGDAK